MSTNSLQSLERAAAENRVYLLASIGVLLVIGGLYSAASVLDGDGRFAIVDVDCNVYDDRGNQIYLTVQNTGDRLTPPVADVHIYDQQRDDKATEFLEQNWSHYAFTASGQMDTVILNTRYGLRHKPLEKGHKYRVEVTLQSETQSAYCQPPGQEVGGDNITTNASTPETPVNATALNITAFPATEQNDTQEDSAYNDSVTPVTTDNYVDDGWGSAPQTITLTCNDDNSGCRGVQWAITQNGDVLEHTTTEGRTVTMTIGSQINGELTVQYRGIDNATNIEDWNTQTVRIDTTAPTTTITRPDPGTEQTSDFTVTVDDTDNLGLTSCQYRINDTDAGNTGWTTRTCNQQFTVTVGNTSNCQTEGNNICEVTTRAVDRAGSHDTATASYTINYTTNTGEDNETTSDNETSDNETTTETYTYTISTAQDWESGTFEGTVTINDMLQLGYPDTASGLNAYWRLDGTGGAVTDYSGTGNDGENNGATSGVGGLFGTDAFQFDSTNEDYVAVPDSPSLDSELDELTVSAWVRFDDGSTADDEMLIVKQRNGPNSYILQREADEDISLNGDGFAYTTTNPDSITDTDWYHIAGTVNETHVRIYINGVLQVETTGTDFTVTDGDKDLVIGGYTHDPCCFLTGRLDEVQVYDMALSASDVKQLYFEGMPFTGTYTHTIDTDQENNWTTLEVTANIPTDTGVDATVEALDSAGAVTDSQTVTLTDGVTNHTISVEDVEDARLRIQGDSDNVEETWHVNDVTLYYRN